MSFLTKLRFHPTIVIVFLSAIASVVAAAFMLLLPFDGIEFNGDSFVYFCNARSFSEAILENTLPEPAHWPYGYPALLSLSFLIGDVSFESARWVNVLIGGFLTASLCCIMLFIVRLKKMSDFPAFILVLSAGAWTLAHGYFLKYQLSMMSDLSAALWGTLMMLACWHWRVSGNKFILILGGAFLGLAVFTRYVYVLMFVPAVVALFWDIDFRSLKSIKQNILSLFIFTLSAFLIFLPQLLITIKDLSSSAGNGLLQGWRIHNFFTLTYESIDGHQPATIPGVLYYALLPFQWKCFTPFAILMIIPGIRYAVKELPPWLWLSIAVWHGTMYILLCGIPLQNARIGFPLFLPVLIVLSLGTIDCFFRWKRHFGKILGLVSAAWVISLIFSFRFINKDLETKNELKQAADLVTKFVPKKSSIISTSLCAVYLAYPSDVKAYSIYLISIPEMEKLLNDAKPVFLAIDEDRFSKQWAAYPPGKCYSWIKSHYACRNILKAGEFTVYEVKPLSKFPVK